MGMEWGRFMSFKKLISKAFSVRRDSKMNQQGNGQPPVSAHVPYIVAPPYQTNQMIGSSSDASSDQVQTPQTDALPASSAHMMQHQLAYQHIHQQQQLQSFWANQFQDIEQVTDFKNHSLPLARIKKIMKADEDVRMISAEAPVIFARACEMFIFELTLRAWNHAEENKRRTLQKNDITAAITTTDIFDFLVDTLPREDLKEEMLASIPRGTPPVGGPVGVTYYYMPPQSTSPVGASTVYMGKPMNQTVYNHQSRPYMPQQVWPHQHQPPEDS